jgi:hypothetical protein
MRKIFVLIFIVLIGFSSASVVRTNFNLSSNSFQSFNAGTVNTGSVLVEINTNQNSYCKYSLFRGMVFESMSEIFDRTGGMIHQKTLIYQNDEGVKYYVRCQNDEGVVSASELEIIFNINIPVSAQVVLSERPPLKAGSYEVTVITSKETIQKPVLQYSTNGIVFNPIPLFGTGKIWKGYLIIPGTIGEAVGSFKFEGIDLTGRKGERIEGESIFLIDTKKPELISTFRGTGLEGQIRLEWYMEEENEKYNIYRSTSPNIDQTFFYKHTDKTYFIDNEVEKGRTYYYRVSAVDRAGNIGDLSKEIMVTALINNITTSSGLNVQLLGLVDNLLTEIGLLNDDLKTVREGISRKSERERLIFEELKLTKELDRAQSEINMLKNDVEKYKLQNLNRDELEKKLSSSSLKLNIIKGIIPEDLIIKNDESVNTEINEEIISYLLAEHMPQIDDKERRGLIKSSVSLAKDIKIRSEIIFSEVLYLDGSRKEQSLFIHSISSELERESSVSMILSIPFDVAMRSSEISMNNLNYKTPKEGPLFVFESDVKKISYSMPKRVDASLLKEIKISPVVIESNAQKSSFITGYAVFENGKGEQITMVILFLTVIGLSFYFIQFRRKKETLPILEKIYRLEDMKKKGLDISEEYKLIKEEYKSLDDKQKRIVFKELKELLKKK